MDEAAFKNWLKNNGAATEAGRNTRAYAVRKIEMSLKELGFDFSDLAEVYRSDRFAALRACIKDIRADSIAGGQRYRVLMPESENPKNRLASWNSWLAQYGRYLQSLEGDEMDERFLNGMAELRAKFEQRMPDFHRFGDEEGAFWDAEAQYKQHAHGAITYAANSQEGSIEDRGRDIYKRLSRSHAQGMPLGWRTPGEVPRAPAALQTRFYECVARLAKLTEDNLAGLEDEARELERLRDEGLSNLKRVEVLGISISVFGTINPSAACWFKVRTFDRLGKLILGRRLFPSSQFEIDEFEEFQTLMFRMKGVLDAWGWEPQNLSDVQGFVWVAMAETWGDESASGLTREAVERAMDECEEIGSTAFLTKYGFGRPRLYWVRREPDGSLYPAKAIVGAAHGFMPGGTAQRYNEFHSGSGDQDTNGILQSLGFEIVNVRENGMTPDAKPAANSLTPPTNLILYGPPGTGKTFATAEEAVRLCGEPVPGDRNELMATYRRLCADKRIEFVTFHQSMSYEDFVEGKQPVTGPDENVEGESTGTGFRLDTFPGIFRRIAKRAETSLSHSSRPDALKLNGRRVFKTSIGEAANPEDAHLFEDAIANGYTILGYDDIDWSDPKFASRDAIIEACRALSDTDGEINAMSGRVQMPFIFRNWVNKGDIVIVSKGNSLFRAIGEFTGNYEFHPRPEGGYAHRRAVKWLWVDREGVSVSEIYQRKFSMRTIYVLTLEELNVPALERYINSQQVTSSEPATPDQFVLIIDEINRANISKVFGELITLLEPNKRLGMPNELKVRLPYSGHEFGVPANLHIVGTMNTADRSISLLDTALRRRFQFRELLPDPTCIDENVEGVSLQTLLTRLNERIEYLFDRDHQIGHAYFIGCSSRQDLDDVMRHKVIPLLAEYFYEDWSKVAAVLGDSRGERFLERRALTPPEGLDIDNDAPPRWRWSVRDPFTTDAYAAFT